MAQPLLAVHLNLTLASKHSRVAVPQDSKLMNGHLTARDWLREHPADAARYAKLKRELAGRFKAEREAYTTAKGEFIEQMLAQAKTYGHSAA